jgi:caffeoyl-CoA O-methyltransferase
VIVTDSVSTYLKRTRMPPDPVLAEMEAHAARDGIPVIVPETGQLLQVLALASGARRAVEVGTAIGVSALYTARGLAPGGSIVSFEIDPERHAAARGYLARAGVGDRADLRLQDAREGIAAIEGAFDFDFAFVDGFKTQYGDYFDELLPRLAPGAVLAVDNALMSGAVAEGRGDDIWTDQQVSDARAFNQRLLAHPELVGTLTPVGDGVLVAVKREA